MDPPGPSWEPEAAFPTQNISRPICQEPLQQELGGPASNYSMPVNHLSRNTTSQAPTLTAQHRHNTGHRDPAPHLTGPGPQLQTFNYPTGARMPAQGNYNQGSGLTSRPGGNPPLHQVLRPDLYAYGQSIPIIKREMKPNQLPTWDGNQDTAIHYFAKLQALAQKGGYMSEAVAFWAGERFVEGSSISNWFLALDPSLKDKMQSNCVAFIKTICTYYLGDTWTQRVNQEFAQQSFHQKDHAKESPEDIVLWHAILSRMLNYAVPGSKEEASLILKNAPVQWWAILAIDSIKDTATLQMRVTEHKEALTYSAMTGSFNRQYATG